MAGLDHLARGWNNAYAPQMARLAFIGLGVMGAPIARHLAGAGHEVTVYNRTADKAAAWVAAHGGRSAATPADAARDQDAVLTCVGNDDDLAAVTLGPDGAFGVMRKGAVFIDHTTVSADNAIEELLRYDGPVHVTARIATQDVEIGGETIRAGDWPRTPNSAVSTRSMHPCRAGRRGRKTASCRSCAADRPRRWCSRSR